MAKNTAVRRRSGVPPPRSRLDNMTPQGRTSSEHRSTTRHGDAESTMYPTSNRAFELLTVTVAVVIISLARPAAAAAQQYDTPLPCPVKDVRSKQRLTALPSQVIQPNRTADGWPDLQGNWTS